MEEFQGNRHWICRILRNDQENITKSVVWTKEIIAKEGGKKKQEKEKKESKKKTAVAPCLELETELDNKQLTIKRIETI